ncbi:PaaI family thioesterase [Paracrocinitomix mangrovi]|uniref:PaaI family thioesterase n=1 Tax=Paracrocinitomix mangrovi TaxID=2862509 RepID=UPI001C8DA7DC|nr:PaaI family thioesterase [Paracrocinitomix mangrovi]UKN02616.1 PaaI family thioesterase [Paracrocinitomix mangrovi]
MKHFDRLLKMYELAPIHEFYKGIHMELADKKASITLPVDKRYFHAGMSAHGSVYFKLLDDAAYFACQTVVEDYFIVTTSFSINLLRPITSGIIKAEGELDFMSKQMFTASSKLFDEKGRLVGTGQGSFLKSALPIQHVEGYS